MSARKYLKNTQLNSTQLTQAEMEAKCQQFSDNLIYAVLDCFGIIWQYELPSSSPSLQGTFNELFGTLVKHICQASWPRIELDIGQTLCKSKSKEELFLSKAEYFRLLYPGAHQSFARMVHVAVLAAFFMKAGFGDACNRVFDIISQHRKEHIAFAEEIDLYFPEVKRAEN